MADPLEDMRDVESSFDVGQDVDLEKRYDEINVKTMYDMLEQVGDQKLFFFTNRQADLLSESEASVDKLLGALDMAIEPKLLIVLQSEFGFTEGNSLWQGPQNWGRFCGMEYQRGPFASEAEDADAIAKLDRFMLDVMIPLAERTNALVVLSGLQHNAVSSAFTRILKLNSARYPNGKPPFTVVGFVEDLVAVLANPKDGAHYRRVMRGSKAWKKRHASLMEGIRDVIDGQKMGQWLEKTTTAEQKLERQGRWMSLSRKERHAEVKRFCEPQRSEWEGEALEMQLFDLNKDAPCLIIADGIDAKYDPKKDGPCTKFDFQGEPLIKLRNTLIKRVSSVLPAIAVKSGGTMFENLDSQAEAIDSLFRSLDMIGNGIPVLFLDVIERPWLEAGGSRALLIESAKKAYVAHQERLLKTAGVVDSFNVCAIAWFYDVLFGDGDARTSARRATHGSGGDAGPTAIHVALRRKQRARSHNRNDDTLATGGDAFTFDPADDTQVGEVCRWLARVRSDFNLRFRRLKIPLEDDPELAGEELDPDAPSGAYHAVTLPKVYGKSIAAEELAFRSLLLDDKFNACHAGDVAGARQLVDTLCRTSRLPRENSVEALSLLQRAWVQHDIAMHLARFYKRLGRCLYLLYLIIGQATVTCTAVFLARGTEQSSGRGPMQYTLFALSMAGSVVLIADRFFNPSQRGGQLRAGAAQLESIIWRFRTRIGSYAVPQGNAAPKGPDYALRDAMTQWHEDLTAGTDLLATALDKRYPAAVYLHGQYEGDLPPARHASLSPRRAAADARKKQATLRKLDEKLSRMEVQFFPDYFGPTATKELPPDIAALVAQEPVSRRNLQAAAAARRVQQQQQRPAAPVAPAEAPAAAELPSPGAAGGGSRSRAAPSSEAEATAIGGAQRGMSDEEVRQAKAKIEKLTAVRRERAKVVEEAGFADDVGRADDFHSPVEPADYIELRLNRMVLYYQEKIPLFYNWRRFWELVLAACTVGAATLSFLSELSAYVAVATSIAAGATSWNAHDDLTKRISRYTNAVRSIERLQWWWKSLDDIERASASSITLLVESGEAIISAERLAWLAAFKKQQTDKAGKPEDEDSDTSKKPVAFKRSGLAMLAPTEY